MTSYESFGTLLKKVVDNRGKTCPTVDYGIPLIATNCISNDYLYPLFIKIRYVNDDTYKHWFRAHPEPGDMIFVLKGTPGRVAWVPDPVNFCIAQDMVAIRADQGKIYPKYLFAALRSKTIQQQIERLHVGTLIPHFKKGDFDDLLIPIPGRKIQRFIGDQYFNLSLKINLLHRQNDTLEALAQTLFRQWFIEEAEDDWEVGVLPDEFNFTMGLSPPGNSYNENGIGTPMFQGNADFSFRFPNNRVYTTDPRRFAEKFDTLISVRAPVGAQNMAKDKCCIGRGVAAFRYKRNINYYSYTYYKLNSIISKIRTFEDSGTVFGSINKSDFETLEIIIPPDNKIKKFDQEVKPVDNKIYSNSLQIHTIEKLRDTLLPKLMSGQVRVSVIKGEIP